MDLSSCRNYRRAEPSAGAQLETLDVLG